MFLIIKTQEAGIRDEDCELYHAIGNRDANEGEGELFILNTKASNDEMRMGDD